MPAGHDGEGLPLLVDLVGFTSSGLSDANWVGFRESLPERLDRLIGEQLMPPVVVAFPIASPGSAVINTSTQLPPALGRTSCCTRWCRQSSSASVVGVPVAAASSARAPADMARSRMRYATPTSGRRGVAFRRYGLRAVLSARHADRPAGPRWCGELRRALVAATRSRQKHPEGSFKPDLNSALEKVE